MALKRCTKCGIEKPLEAFHKHARSLDGRQVWCKECYRRRALERWRRLNPGRPVRRRYSPDATAKACRCCGLEKPVEAFHRAKRGACGRKAICGECEAKRRDPLASRRSLLRNKYGLALADYEAMFTTQEGKCYWCGTSQPGKGEQYFHVDHDHMTGKVICLSCANCNVGRGYFRDSGHMATVAARWRRYEEGMKE